MGDIRSCSCYRAVKIFEHGMRRWKGVIKKLHRIENVSEMQFSFMPERGTNDAMFILRRPYSIKLKKSHICVLWTKKSF